jgi:hypothetical protein
MKQAFQTAKECQTGSLLFQSHSQSGNCKSKNEHLARNTFDGELSSRNPNSLCGTKREQMKGCSTP